VAQSKAPSSGFRLARGLTPPSSGFRLARGLISASLEAPSQAHLLPHAGTGIQCSDTAGPRHHAPGNHAPALFRQLPRGNPSPPLQGAVRYGRCQPRGTVLPTPVRLTRRALEGWPAAPSNPSLVNLQGQTMTSSRRERHPRHCWSCAAVPVPAAPRRALLQQLRRCWARGEGTAPRLPLYPVRVTVNGFLEPVWRRPSQPPHLHPRSRPCSSTGHATTTRLGQGPPGRPPTPRRCTPYFHM
jgi:hypothetical protein